MFSVEIPSYFFTHTHTSTLPTQRTSPRGAPIRSDSMFFLQKPSAAVCRCFTLVFSQIRWQLAIFTSLIPYLSTADDYSWIVLLVSDRYWLLPWSLCVSAPFHCGLLPPAACLTKYSINFNLVFKTRLERVKQEVESKGSLLLPKTAKLSQQHIHQGESEWDGEKAFCNNAKLNKWAANQAFRRKD